ncbi:type I polyketide synthase [Neotamlana nanhaiensis]|uniref:type I polyketide synthase n=1 Tax=Neotamlana nanhaiensis TaxID=1382798 RepID=UPI00069C47CB|nr:type I polyketide synthase [Tamlana nanhaiensis]
MTKINHIPEYTIIDLFQKQVEKTPNNIALVYNKTKITYKELDILSNQFSNYITSSFTVGLDDLVSVTIDTNHWIIIAFLGILKSGAAYVPIDPNYPKQRRDYIQQDSKCKLTVDNDFVNAFIDNQKTQSKSLEHNITPKVNSLCYVIYTSGTTGNPKGVMLEHRNITSLLFSGDTLYDFNENDVWCMFHSFCFDVSVWEMYGALFFGGKLIILDKPIIKDAIKFLTFLEEEKITILNQTPSAFINLVETTSHITKPDLALRYIIFAGEALYPKYLKTWYNRYPKTKFINMYGITEITVHAMYKEIGETEIDGNISNIGKALQTLAIHLLDANKKPTAVGETGEIYVSGLGVARGYLNREELTNERFTADINDPNLRMYRSGDLAKLLPNGEMEFVGRVDDQVKIRGYRIELREVESAINSLPKINRTVVLTNNQLDGETRLIAYVQPTESHGDTSLLKTQLADILPEYMIPSLFVWVEKFPLTSNGKVDKKNLPSPEYKRQDATLAYEKPRNSIEKEIASIWSDALKIDKVGINDNFFDMGGTSLLAQKVTASMIKNIDDSFSVSKIYTNPTIKQLSETIEQFNDATFTLEKNNIKPKEVAVIGMSGRFPGAATIDELWEVIKEGKETISFFTKEELDPSIPDYLKNDPQYVSARGVLPEAKTFDAEFFGLNPLLAKAMDPQQRLFLEICWEALEQSGHLPKHYKGKIGVYAGSEVNSYYESNVFLNEELKDLLGYMQIYSVNGKDFIAPRVSYHLDLKGPAVSLYSACSTSLLAVAEAVKSIQSGQCDVALAGGSSVTSPINSGHVYDEGYILNPDGHTRPFDASGKGTVFSDGAGVVVLKSLEEAQKDGDTIYGIIKGTGVNNDGGNRGSFMTPNSKGQSEAIKRAFNDAQILPSTISYVEAHGTSTPVGDPIEVEGLKLAFGKQENNGFCAIGSIKGNFGHTTSAAGVAGLIKVMLSLKHKQLPPLVGFKNPNPNIDFKNSPFYINANLSPWEAKNGPRRAGISSFGVGSTNVHVIVEEYDNPEIKTDSGRPFNLLTWSAKSQNSLNLYKSSLSNYLIKENNTSIADIAYSLSNTREDFNNRSFLVTNSKNHALEHLTSNIETQVKSHNLTEIPSEISFLFPGQGAQYLQMGKTLYDNEIVFKEAIDTCAEILKSYLKLDIRDIIYPKVNTEKAENDLRNTFYTQPALFITEYALAKLWLSWGIKPTMLCGHSVGEFVAAHLAGVFSLKDALYIVTTRSRLVSELPGGSMLSVRLPENEVIKILPKNLSIAAVNSKQLCVVAGEDEVINAFSTLLTEQEIPNKTLFTSHAFHSEMMNPMLKDFEDALKNINFSIPRLPIISTVTGTWLKDAEATSVTYWVNHVKNTVRFADALDTIVNFDDSAPVLLEIGPGKALTSLAYQQASGKALAAFHSFSFNKDNEAHAEYNSILNALGELWSRGFNIDWNAFYKQQKRKRINLPSYAFDRKPCWVEPQVYNGLNGFGYITNKTQNNEPKTQETPSLQTSKTVSNSDAILSRLSEMIKVSCGITLNESLHSKSFLEIGLDSLVLAQLSASLKKEFNLLITFRQLNEDLATPNLLATYIKLNAPNSFITPKAAQPQQEIVPNTNNNKDEILNKISEIIKKSCGINITPDTYSKTFLEVGLDSLVLAQLSASLKKEFDLLITFRQLNEELATPNLLANHIDKNGYTSTISNTNNNTVETIVAPQVVKPEQNINLDGILTQLQLLNSKIESLQNKLDSTTVNNQSNSSEVKNIISEHDVKNNTFPNTPPVVGAKLGRDPNGNPAWYVPDPNQVGNYIKVEN